MPASAEQLAERKRLIGASDVPAILGVSRFKTAADVYHRIVDGIEGEPAGEAADFGVRLEPAVLDWFEETRGVSLTRQYTARHDGLRLIAHIDGVYGHGNDLVVVEAKTAGFFAPLTDDWGEFGTDEVPGHVVAQVQAQMIALHQTTGRCADHAFVVACLKRPYTTDFGVYRIARDVELMQLITNALSAFVHYNIGKGVVPPVAASPDVLKRMRRVPNKVVTLPDELVVAWKAATEHRRAAEKVEDDAKARIIEALGDAEAGTTTTSGAVTYRASTTPRLDVKSLESEHPELVEKYRVKSTFPTLRAVKKI